MGAVTGIVLHLMLWSIGNLPSISGPFSIDQIPLLAVLLFGGAPLLWDLVVKIARGDFGSDLLAGLSIVTSVVLQEYLAGALVVLMLSGGAALEAYAVRRASSVLEALAKRMPAIAHRSTDGRVVDVAINEIAIGDNLVVFPHEICPVDGVVVDGRGSMDESYLTGEPYVISKTPGAEVLSGAINGESALTIEATRLAVDSRYSKIMKVMRESEQRRPNLRRLGDRLGAIYTPVAVAIALLAWYFAGDPLRFLAVLVVATPCPLLIAIPVAIIGSISLATERGIIIKNPAILESIDECRVAIFDKTGTLTYGSPRLMQIVANGPVEENSLLELVASLEQYSKHPLSAPTLAEARRRKLPLRQASQCSERPGQGLQGIVDEKRIEITSRAKLEKNHPDLLPQLPPHEGGMECVVLIDGRLGGVLRFRDEPRREGMTFVRHLGPKHNFERILIVSGDRESEVRYLADRVGIKEVHFSQSPEQKLALVEKESQLAKTVFLGDGINDAPALVAATVGIAFGQNSDITSEAADAVVLESSLERVDELLHVSQRMRAIALQSAVGGMALSVLGMIFAALGYLPPVSGAIAQEIIDVLAVGNALRVAIKPEKLTDF